MQPGVKDNNQFALPNSRHVCNSPVCSTLREVEEMYQAFMEFSNDAIFIFSLTPDGLPKRFVEVNNVTCQRLKYTKDELLSLSPLDINFVNNPQDLIVRMAHIRTNQRFLYEAVHVAKDGQTIPVEINSHLFNLKGQPAVLSIARDISERKRFEQEMDRLDRLHLVGEMAASIGHEIRNPMTTVRGFLQLLGAKKEFDHHREYFDLMIDELDRANLIISEFLALAKTKTIYLEINNLNTIITTIQPLLVAASNIDSKRIELDLSDIPDLPLDAKEMRQLILNLACNGLEAMKAGGTLIIRTCRDKGRVILSVTDQGSGIPSEVLDKIGTPFFTTKMYGTGLGVAICYSIADRHNATINIATSPAGTTFSVCFTLKHLE
jgi:two-component system, sporulation sensor kinase E